MNLDECPDRRIAFCLAACEGIPTQCLHPLVMQKLLNTIENFCTALEVVSIELDGDQQLKLMTGLMAEAGHGVVRTMRTGVAHLNDNESPSATG